FKAFSPRALQAVAVAALQAAGFAIQMETTSQAYRHGLVVREVPIIFRDRRAGSSKMSRGIVLEALVLPWRLRGAAAPHVPGVAPRHAAASPMAGPSSRARTGSTPPEVAA